jgi:hypothetical protein
MLQANSIAVSHISIEVLSATASTIEVGLYVLNWSTRILSRIPNSGILVVTSAIGILTTELAASVVLQPGQQYFVGFCPSGDTVIRTVGAVMAPWKVAGAALADTIGIISKQAKAWTVIPHVDLLSLKGNEVL